jgi:hypothetical protein
MEQSTFGVDHLRDTDNGFMEPREGAQEKLVTLDSGKGLEPGLTSRVCVIKGLESPPSF